MSIKGSLTKELNESVSNLLGPNVKISLKCLVKMEIKAEKTDNKILAFSACRLFILTAKVPTKIEQTFHYLDINSIESKKQSQLTLGICGENKSFTFHSVDPNNGEEINLMIIQLGTAIKTIFPHVSLDIIIRKIDVEPSSRLKPMLEYNDSVENRARDNTLEAPCGAFSTQYACMCDYFGYPYREEVSWDVDSIYYTHNITELSLLDFEHLDTKDLVPIIAALSYNGWFTKFRANNVKVFTASNHASNDVANEIVNLLKRSSVLEEVHLENTGIKSDFVNKLFMGLLTNSHSSLHTIDLSNNFIEDKSLKSLCGFVAKVTKNDNSPLGKASKLNKGLVSLNLAHTGITAKGVSELADALSLNRSLPSTLTYLNLSGNILKDDVNKLYNFLAQPNCLVQLDLSSTECCLDTVFGALLRGCTQKLSHLNLSRNQFSCKKSHKEVNVPPSFKQFFSSTIALKTLNLSSNKLPADALKAMLLGFACNEIATDVRLNLSSNELKSNGATVLELCMCGIRCISGFDLSDNGFDADIAVVIGAISKNKSIKYLSIGKNFNNIKPKHMSRVLDSLVQLIQDEDASLESLSISDSKLKNDTSLIINAIGSNHSLINIDVTGNLMGLSGAKTFAKALQVNSKLETIYLDRNMIPTVGFIDIAYSLERNFTLRHMPIPMQDVQAAMVKTPERMETAINKIQELLRRNNLPHTLLRNTRLHGYHLPYDNDMYQMVEKLSVHLQDIISNHVTSNNNDKTADDDNDKSEELLKAEGVLKDAVNAKQLLMRLNQQFIFPDAKLESGRRFSSAIICKPVEVTLLEFANELKNTTEAYIINTVTGMLQYVEEICPNVTCNNSKLQSEFQRLITALPSSPMFPSVTYFQNCLTENVGTYLTTKIEEFLQTIAVQICDKILIEVNECLSSSHRALTGQEQKVRNYQRSSTPDVLRNRVWGEGSYSRESSTEGNLSSDMEKDLDATTATPKQSNQKRQSLYNRRLRPQSVIDGFTADDTPDLLPKAESLIGASDSTEASLTVSMSNEALEHLGKLRPKRPKTRAPTRAKISSNKQNLIDKKLIQKENSSTEKLDEGLENFFKKPVTAEVQQKPAIQPRGLLKKIGIRQNNDTRSGPPLVSKLSVEEKSTVVTEESNDSKLTSLLSRSEEVTRSRSSPNLGNKKQSQSKEPTIIRNQSPGAEEISNILERVERISSPVPPEHADLLLEMKQKQGKRSLAPTPTPATITEEETSPSTIELPSSTTTQLQGIKLRASIFGDVTKSPNKVLSSSAEEPNLSSSSYSESGRSSLPRQSAPPQLKQRPKSVVGILGSKFEMSNSGKRDIDIGEGTSSAENSKSEKLESENRSHVRKTLGVFTKSRNSSYYSSSVPK